MSLNDQISEFMQLQEKRQREILTPGCVWAVVKTVDWDKKTMVAQGVQDDLEYYDVQLGLGSFYRKPVVGSTVMLGVPELQGNETFLIECEDFEEALYVSGDLRFSMLKNNGYKIERGGENLGKVLEEFMEECRKIVVVNGNTINQVAVAELKTRLKTILITQ